nr:MAG TPA: hypothetical protein [Caudoviricetes sp.]
MKQVNFKELNVEVGIDQYQNHDLRKEIGNTLHRASESVPMSELARNIYYSEGDIKIPDEEFDEMMKLIKPGFKRFVLDSIVRSATEVETETKDKEE